MDLQIIPLAQFENFLICASRTGAIIGAIPVFSSRQIPPQLKVGLTFATALLLFPLMAPYTPDTTYSPLTLGLLMANEVLLGLMIGLTANLVFTAVNFGGTVIGYQMGFAAANIFDPQTTQQLSLMSQFQNVMAILIFLALDVHHMFFRLIIESYQLLPPGYLNFSNGAVELLMNLGSRMFILGVKFSAPILIILLLSNMVLGIMARIFPQLNVFMLSFPLNIGIALIVIGLTLNSVLLVLGREFDTLGRNILLLFELLR
ncbi:flagellar biosynthetic protein FliR [Desulfolithobacter sp.]